jgi:phage baseplate assembly protein W
MTTKAINRIYSDIDLNFLAHPNTGDVSKKYDVDAVKQALKTLILTNFYERPFQPKLGSPVYGMLFENIDIPSANSLKLRLELLISQYEPRVRAQEVTVVPLYDENSFRVSIYFYVVGVRDPVTFSTILKRTR